MYKSVRFNRFYLVVGAIAAVIITLALKAAFTRAEAESAAASASGITGFLAKYGWIADEENGEVKEVQIPSHFTDVYNAYNELQISQGYDLSKYRTDYVREYTFPVTNYINSAGERLENVYAHVLVSGNKIIGGDICCTDIDGFMHGFSG